MKIRNLFLTMLIIAGTLVSCNKKEETPVNKEEGKGFVAISLQLSAPSTRAEDDAHATAAEKKVNTVDLFLVKNAEVTHAQIAISAYDVNLNVYKPKTEAVVQVAEGSYTIYALTNLNDEQRTALKARNSTQFGDALARTLAETASFSTGGSEGFVSAGKTENVSTKKTKDLAAGQAETIEVSRVVAKVRVTATTKNYTATNGATKDNKGYISDVKYRLGNMNTTMYYFPTTAGQDPNFSVSNASGDATSQEETAFGNSYKEYPFTGDEATVQKWTNVLTANDETAGNQVYALENTNAKYYVGNTTYVLVQAKFEPQTIQVGGTRVGKTFWLGNNDGQFYNDEASAKAASNSAPVEYKDGICYYHIWAGQTDPSGNPDAAAFSRNHFYHIDIKDINGIGSPSDPVSGDPDAQPTPVKPELDPKKPITASSFIAATIEVQKWTYNSRDVEL